MTVTDDNLTDDLADDLDGTVARAEPADREATTSVSLFEGDEGGLEYPERRLLVTLLKQRFISNRTHPRDWSTLLANERVIRGRLNDLFLDLAVDRVREVAWKRQAVGEAGQRFPTLLYDTSWSREETIVLVCLRDRFRTGLASGESRVFVDREDLVDYVASFRPPYATDVAGDEKRARNAVASIVKAGLLIGATIDERFEISEAIEPLLPLELLQELLDSLRTADVTPAAPDPDATDTALFSGYEPPADGMDHGMDHGLDHGAGEDQ